MAQILPENDPFPPSEFDQWAERYDEEVVSEGFPFTGYRRVVERVVQLAEARAGMSVLDLGAGTGNLAERFVALGCEVWGTDFSEEMLKQAQRKLPSARFLLHDLRQPFPPALVRRFDRIVSGYVFHHFELPEKVEMAAQLWREHLLPGGRLVIADLSFPTRAALEAVRAAAGAQWDEEPYWIAAEAVPALERLGLTVEYEQVSDCAGIYLLHPPASGRS